MIVFNMRMAEELTDVLDEIRRQEKDLPNRSEMARRCIEIVGQMRKVKVPERAR